MKKNNITLLEYCNDYYNLTRCNGEHWDGETWCDYEEADIYSEDNLPPLVEFDSVEDFVSEIGIGEAQYPLKDYQKEYGDSDEIKEFLNNEYVDDEEL